jgi:photosystem II stability/assembly factor-like uncharacterized protein
LAAGCGGTKQSSTNVPATTIATTTTVSVTTTAAPSTGSAVPVGFVPQSFTAISDSDYWVLGSVPCPGGRCTAIARTTDGGASFSSVRAPDLQNVGAAGAQPNLRFADHDDGWAFVNGDGGAFYVTHDGGASWHHVGRRSLIAFATGGGYVYAVTARCTPDSCSAFRFERAPVSLDAWTTSVMPFPPDSPVLDLSAHGTSVWVLATRAGQVGGSRYDVLAHSTDAGKSFTVGDGPCFPGLGGTLAPSSANVLWAVCPTGMMAGAARSIDCGVTFAPLHLQNEIPNSTALAPASDESALLIINAGGATPLLTTDAGAHWTTPRAPVGATAWAWAGFTDAETGAAIVQTRYDTAGRVQLQQLWRTTDGGSSWSVVRFR